MNDEMGKNSIIRCWIEAMRLRTLPTSVAGVVMGAGLAMADGRLKLLPVVLCLAFALLAQIASNFANEYYDYRDGLDRKGREGPRRGVTEGDITPGAMLLATYFTLGAACIVGCSLILFGGWWLLLPGVVIALGALAYSAGPYPLSRHGLGEVAVIAFFGIAPVTLTYYVQTLCVPAHVWMASVAVGLLAANVLIVNNYRDLEDDAAVGKHTLAVIVGRRAMRYLYLMNVLVAVGLTVRLWNAAAPWAVAIPMLCVLAAMVIWWRLSRLRGRSLNPFLGITAMLMLFFCAGYFLAVI